MAVGVRVAPEDFRKCLFCGDWMMVVGVWDGEVKELELRWDFDADNPIHERDFKGRLVVFDGALAQANRHELFCPNFPRPKDDGGESKPYVRGG